MSDSMTNILFFDTETTEDGKHLIDIGAVSEDGTSIHTSDRNAFASFAAGYEYLCGHNILSHDLKYVDEELLGKIRQKRSPVEYVITRRFSLPSVGHNTI